MTDTDIYNLVENAFAGVLRPAHFTDPRHCPECKDHDDALCSKSVETLTLAEVGNSCWDPICFITPEGMQYYFPALVRLALTQNAEHELYDPYIYQFLKHISTPNGWHSKFSCFTQIQKEAVLMVLKHILEHHISWSGDWNADEGLLAGTIRWEEFVTKTASGNSLSSPADL